jgi:AraC-like DNA-binding protein
VDDFYLVILPITGGVTVGTREEAVVVGDDVGVVTAMERPYYFERWSPDCRFVCIRFDKWRLNDALVRLARRPVDGNVEFASRIDLSQSTIAPFRRAVQLLVGELNDPGSQISPLMSRSIADLVMNALLLHQPHNHSGLLEAPGGDLPACLREAQTFMHSHLGEEITVADIARSAEVSVRTLEEVFQRAVGVSPMTAFRELRLARAHDDLSTAAPESTTVAQVANRWGFRHQGRFAIEYRRAYGMSPSAQLRRRGTPHSPA